MSDYISREEAIKAFGRCADMDFPYVCEETPREIIESIPSADVTETKHGFWEEVKDLQISGRTFVCSQCGEDYTFSGMAWFKYCPECGAKMDLEGTDG